MCEWKALKDCCPANRSEVITFSKSRGMDIAWYDHGRFETDTSNINPTHWAELPPLPKGE